MYIIIINRFCNNEQTFKTLEWTQLSSQLETNFWELHHIEAINQLHFVLFYFSFKMHIIPGCSNDY